MTKRVGKKHHNLSFLQFSLAHDGTFRFSCVRCDALWCLPEEAFNQTLVREETDFILQKGKTDTIFRIDYIITGFIEDRENEHG